MIVTGASSHGEYQQINPSKGNLLSMEGNMNDALFNVAVFTTLALSIVGFSAWAHIVVMHHIVEYIVCTEVVGTAITAISVGMFFVL
jgi:hypothetical protein